MHNSSRVLNQDSRSTLHSKLRKNNKHLPHKLRKNNSNSLSVKKKGCIIHRVQPFFIGEKNCLSDHYLQSISLTNTGTGKIFHNRLGFKVLELPKFEKKEDEPETKLDVYCTFNGRNRKSLTTKKAQLPD
ncbi:PD-(D/E)XK nuclease family transposase [Pedobacter sp. WC2423]|uniref:PD-(D/E)XK nuclease family transposase n=1 Tax=Pedobacter sp. WC2423 TaxID=3234142 RepID=UPI0034674E13